MRIFLLFFTLLLFSGCTTVRPSIAEYSLKTDIHMQKGVSTKCSERSLKISRSFGPAWLASLDMSYELSDNKRFVYSQSQWHEAPKDAVTYMFLANIRDAQIFKSVLSWKSRSVSELILESDIEEFMQYFSADLKESYVKVKISMVLIDSQTKETIAAKTFSSRVPAATADANGAYEAYKASLADIMSQSMDWLAGACR